jgi:hypothetical protein
MVSKIDSLDERVMRRLKLRELRIYLGLRIHVRKA